ncbi:MAG: hypothetical protein HYX20_01860 [Candidatus Yanofskybacteria bacterium]|nr:hypothetical protein [Candidatus Yanofskybacteria bacterium]
MFKESPLKNYLALKKAATKLRLRGLSYGEIKKKTSLPKSTLSAWLKNIPLKPKDRKRLYTKQTQILARGPQSQKERRAREVEEIIKNAESEINFPLHPETLRLMGAALYWAEGNKQGMCEITNSDPHLIAFAVKWIKLTFNISPLDLKARLNIYPQQNDKKIKKFWSELTGIPVKRFGKSFVKPVSKGYKKNNLYYGTIKVEIPKSVNTRYRIFGWISMVLKKINPNVGLTQKKWESLTRIQRPTPANLK